MKLYRTWAMPNSETFTILPVKELLSYYVEDGKRWADPFARNSRLAEYRNDLDPETTAEWHEDALEFLRGFPDAELRGILFDPPYSPRQVSEMYKKLGQTVNMQTTQATFWSRIKDEISRVVQFGGYCISCGWNSNGIGKSRGFELVEILLVPHGGWHNDTIVTVERRV